MRLLLVVLLACLVFPVGAAAATVSRTGGTLHYKAGKRERIAGSITETGSGAFLVRRNSRGHQRLVAGRGCKRGRAGELRCTGQGVGRVEISLKRARTANFTVREIRVPVAARGSGGMNSIFVSRTPDFTYDGGPDRDDVAEWDNPHGHSTVRLGAGADLFNGRFHPVDSPVTFTVDGGPGRDELIGGPGADSLDGGTGSDKLELTGGADTITGGSESDTVQFGGLTSDPNHDDGAVSLTLDGRRNDGAAGQNALVGSDVENATIGPSSRGDEVLVGNDGPNLLIGPGTVLGLAGNDTLVSNNLEPGATLDGGDGDDRIDAVAVDVVGGFDDTAASVVCGAGTDVVFTNAAAPADCEYANVGMHVLGARPIGRKGVVRARIDCTDPRGCRLGALRLMRPRRLVAGGRTTRITIPFGESRTVSAQILPALWKRYRHARSLRLEIDPFPRPLSTQFPAVSTGSYPGALTLRITAG